MTEPGDLAYLPSDIEFIALEACPWCDSKSIYKIATRGDGLPVMRCPECQLAFLGTLPSDLSVFYDEGYFKRSAIPGSAPAFSGYEDYDRVYSPSSFRWLAMLIRATTGPEAVSIFDFGCATGTFLEAASQEDFEAHGSELSQAASAVARQRGFDVRPGPFDAMAWPEHSFDVVTALEVLEHVRDIRSTMADLARIAKTDGMLVFFVPNVSDFIIDKYGDAALDFNKSYDHTFYFNRQFLTRMCDEVFGEGSLTLITKDVEQWEQTVSSALGFVRLSPADKFRDQHLLDAVAGEISVSGIDGLSGYEAIALALTAAKFFDRTRADLSLARANTAGVPSDRLTIARAQVLRNEGGLLPAITLLENLIVGDSVEDARMAASLLIETIEDLLVLFQLESPGLAEGLSELYGRYNRTHSLLLEEERARLPRYKMQVASLKDEAATLEKKNATLQGQVDALQEAGARTWEAMGGIGQELSWERAKVTELSNQSARLEAALNDIYLSRSWKAISRFRTAAALPSRLADRVRQGRIKGDDTARPPSALSSGHTSTPQLWSPPDGDSPVLVSVIMPVFNKGATIRSSLETVRVQTLTPVEVVLWDDGSSDPETLEILLEVRRQPGVTLFHAGNQGVVAARNSAIAMSRGRYICCLDPDDALAPTYLEQAVALLETQPEYSITYPWVETVGYISEEWQTNNLEPRLIIDGNHVPICAVFRREVFEATGGFSTEMTDGYEDWEFWVHAAELGFRGKAIPARLFKYHYSGDSTESRDAKARESHQALKDQIAELHPRLALTGVSFHRPAATNVRPIGRELGPRRLNPGAGRPIVVMIPWLTVGGADRVIRLLITRWVEAGRTVVVFATSRLEPGMPDRIDDLRRLTPYVYNLWDFLPLMQWYDFVASTIGALESPVVFNMGSTWFYDFARALRGAFPELRIIDQQFNAIGHLEWNRALADVIDATVAAYDVLATEIKDDGRISEVATVYVGIERVDIPGEDQIARFRREAGVLDDEKLILFVGRLSKEKRPRWVTRLAPMLAEGEARVVVVGDGPLRKDVSKGADSRELSWIPEVESIEPAIAAADVVVIPSRVEGIPLVALEALSLGTPIVATRVGGLPDLEHEEGVTLVDPDDFDGFFEAVRKSLGAVFGPIELAERFLSEEMLDRYDRLLFREASAPADS